MVIYMYEHITESGHRTHFPPGPGGAPAKKGGTCLLGGVRLAVPNIVFYDNIRLYEKWLISI